MGHKIAILHLQFAPPPLPLLQFLCGLFGLIATYRLVAALSGRERRATGHPGLVGDVFHGDICLLLCEVRGHGAHELLFCIMVDREKAE